LEVVCYRYGYWSWMAFGSLNKIKNYTSRRSSPGRGTARIHGVVFGTHLMSHVIMDDEQTRISSTERIERWVMDTDNSVDLVMRRTSMLKNIMCNDDVLIVVCPRCLMARVAACTKEGLEKFADLIKTMDDKAMTGLVVSAYCDVGNDKCGNETEVVEKDEHKSVREFEGAASCMTISEIIDEVTYMRSDSSRDEIMFLTSDELVDVCRVMHRVPLKFKWWDIIMPQVDDRWTKMDWVTNREVVSSRHKRGTDV